MSNINPETIFGTEYTEEMSAALHELKNRPGAPSINGIPMVFPPYQFRQFPQAMYGRWTDERKRDELIQTARLNQLDLYKPLEREKAESMLAKWDTRLVQNERELKDWLDKGWAEKPEDVDRSWNAWMDRIADQAAMRAYDDQKLSPKARAEFDAADRANGDEHLIDLPVPALNKRRGRPSNAEKAAADAAAAK